VAGALFEKLEKHSETLNVSVITAAELRFGAEKAARPKLAELVEVYFDRLAILDRTNEVTLHHARIRSEWKRSGEPAYPYPGPRAVHAARNHRHR
jgi:tRNA(fMet)-specific endonuclease VapC